MIRPHTTLPCPTISFPSATRQLTPFPATHASSLQITDKSATLTPAFATLTSRVKHKSCVCHSYKKHPGWRGTINNFFVAQTSICAPLGHLAPAISETKQPREFKKPAVFPAPYRRSPVIAPVLSLPPVTRHQPRITKSFTIRTYAKCARNSFTRNTSKTKNIRLFRMNTYKKPGVGPHLVYPRRFWRTAPRRKSVTIAPRSGALQWLKHF